MDSVTEYTKAMIQEQKSLKKLHMKYFKLQANNNQYRLQSNFKKLL